MSYKHAPGGLHGEAFMLMWYACKCGLRERIWNSRDGVTPFGCGCPSCGGVLEHVNWALDEFAPKHKLIPGQRFWRDGTADEAEAIIRRRIKQLKDRYPLEKEDEERLIAECRNGKNHEFHPGWPWLDTATAPVEVQQ